MAERISEERRGLIKEYDNVDYSPKGRTSNPRSLLRRRRTLGLLLGAVFALVILSAHSLASGYSASPVSRALPPRLPLH